MGRSKNRDGDEKVMKSLSFRLATIIGVVMLIVFVVLTSIVNVISARTLKSSIDDHMDQIVATNLQKVDSIVDTVEMGADSVAGTVGASHDWSQDTKAFVAGTLAKVVASNDFILSGSVNLEPGVISSDSSAAGITITQADAAAGKYEDVTQDSYINESYYISAKSTGDITFSDPRTAADGSTVITVLLPIQYNGMFAGIVQFDLADDAFSIIATQIARFPSMYVNIINANGTILYSTHTNVIGKAFKDTVSAEAYTEISNGWKSGAPFDVITASNSGTVKRYYSPLTAGSEQWWIQTAVPLKEYNSASDFLIYVMIGVMAAGLIVLIAIIYTTIRKALRPLSGMVTIADQLASGDLTNEIELETRDDEIGHLYDSMQTMASRMKAMIHDLDDKLNSIAGGNFDLDVSDTSAYVGDYHSLVESLDTITERLNSTMSRIRESANQVNSSASQVSSGAQALAQGATEQASSVEELSSTMTEISGQIQKTAEKAKEATKLSGAAGDAVRLSNSKMDEMRQAMQDITNKSGEISKIIKTIDDIAFQTNILALNAAIEAARAGSAGKGFAVVADEVGNLAQKSAKAAQSTAALIEDTVDSVAHGSKLTEETAKALISVSDNTKKVMALIDEISGASERESTGVSQVTEGISQISTVVQTNSATAEESAAASEELSGQAMTMNDLLGKFQLRGEDNASGSAASAKASARTGQTAHGSATHTHTAFHKAAAPAGKSAAASAPKASTSSAAQKSQKQPAEQTASTAAPAASAPVKRFQNDPSDKY